MAVWLWILDHINSVSDSIFAATDIYLWLYFLIYVY